MSEGEGEGAEAGAGAGDLGGAAPAAGATGGARTAAPAAHARLLARLALFGATVIWGTSFTVVQRALADVQIFHFLAYRFSLATLLLLPVALARRAGGALEPGPRAGGAGPAKELLTQGAILGLLLFAGFALQTSGLLWTTPSRSAFLTGLAVVLVPPLAWLSLRMGRGAGLAAAVGAAPRRRAGPAAGVLCAAAGLYLLYRPAGLHGDWTFGRGDALTLAGTLAFSLHIVGIERVLRRGAMSLTALAVAQFAVVALLAAPSLLLAPPRAGEATPFALFAIGLTALAGTVLAYLCQLYAQRHLPATDTVLLLAAEPVVAAVFSVAVGRESWTPALTFGGALILAAMLLAELGGGAGAAPPAVAAPTS